MFYFDFYRDVCRFVERFHFSSLFYFFSLKFFNPNSLDTLISWNKIQMAN